MNLDDLMMFGAVSAATLLLVFTDPMALPEAIRELVYLGSMILKEVLPLFFTGKK